MLPCAALQVIYYSSTSSWQCPSVPMAAGVGTYVVVASDLYQGGAACGQCMSVVSSPPNSAVTPFIAQVRRSSARGASTGLRWRLRAGQPTAPVCTVAVALPSAPGLQRQGRCWRRLPASCLPQVMPCVSAALGAAAVLPISAHLARVQVVGVDPSLGAGSIGAGQNFGGEYGVAVSMVPCPGAAQNVAAVTAATVAPPPPPTTTIVPPVVVAATAAPVVAATTAPVVAASTAASSSSVASSSTGWTAQVTGALVSPAASDAYLGHG